MTANVPITPFIITSIVATMNCSLVTLTVTLKYPKRISVRVLKGKPRINFEGPEDPPSGRAHRIDWAATIDRYLWSQNPDEAYTHTFSIRWPTGQQVLYLQLNALDGRKRPTSRLPFLAVTRRQTVIFYEPWGHALRQYNSWNQTSFANTTIQVTPGQCHIFRPNVVGIPQLTCNIGSPPGVDQPTNCNVTMYVQINLCVYEVRPDSYIRVGTSSTASRFAWQKLGNVPTTADGNNSWTREAPRTGLLVWTPMDIFNFGAAVSPNHLPAPPINASFGGINFTINTFNLNFPSGAGALTIGPIAVTVDGVDAMALRTDWRTYEPPSPFQPVGTVLE